MRGRGELASALTSMAVPAVVGLGVALAGLALSAGLAGAHAGYEMSQPADGETVAEAPPRVNVFFSQEVRRSGGLPVLTVVNDVGDTVSLEAVLDDADRSHVYADLVPALPPGRYTVIWHTLSDEDGEEAQGAFHFFVGEAPAEPSPEPTAEATPSRKTPAPAPSPASPSPTPAADADDGDGVSGGAVVGFAAAAGAVGLLIGGGAGYALRRR